MIRHVVSFTARGATVSERHENAREAKRRLDALVGVVPQIDDLYTGIDHGKTSDHWDLVLIVDVVDEAALAAYMTHPAHQEVMAAMPGLVVDKAVIDVVTG